MRIAGRHTVVADALLIGETHPIYEIAVDPTVAKHAQVRYREGEEAPWQWYHRVGGWIPESFYPVLFFTIEEYIKWYKGLYHNTEE